MGVHKSKKDGKWEAYVYDPGRRRNLYVGRCKLRREALELYRAKLNEINRRGMSNVSCSEYAATWLRLHHGEGTRRPAPATLAHCKCALRPFLETFGRRPIDGGISRKEALRWAKQHRWVAKIVCAMFNDAIDDETCTDNPFANRRQKELRGRGEIFPLTEQEVERLAAIALRTWGPNGYGLVARAWVLFAAWVGTRPGETFRVEPHDLDFARGLVRVTRVKGRRQTEWVALGEPAADAIRALPPRYLEKPGPLFAATRGASMMGYDRELYGYYWRPVRDTFRATVTRERWAELVNGQAEKRLDFYALRHFCASTIVDRGGNEYDVAQQLGNSPAICRKTYIHSYRDRINSANQGRLRGRSLKIVSSVAGTPA